MTTCQLCDAAVLDAYVCTGDARRLELNLGDVPALVEELETVLAKLTRYADQQQRVTGTNVHPLPFHLQAGEIRQALHAVLTSWTRIVYLEHPAPRHLPADRDSACARWLMFYTDWIRRQRWAAEAITNICDAIGDVRHVLDAPPIRGMVHIGQCPHCDGQIHAYLPRDPETPTTVACTGTHSWEQDRWLLLGRVLV